MLILVCLRGLYHFFPYKLKELTPCDILSEGKKTEIKKRKESSDEEEEEEEEVWNKKSKAKDIY